MEKSKTILQLFNLYKNDIYKMDSSYYEILKKIGEQEKLLNETLTDEQKNILSKINLYKNEQTEYMNQHIFKYAYSLSNKLLIESLTGSTVKEN